MSRSSQSEPLFIAGPAGSLEGLLDLPGGAVPSALAVICHPHPLHGGTMQNKVAHTLARAFVSRQFAALRFNFRGVGKSEGQFDDGTGELADALAAITYLRSRYPDMPLWLAGFSFGGAVAIRAADSTDVNGLVAVAPAAHRFADSAPLQPTCPWLIVHGEDDELVAVDDTIKWVNSLAAGPELRIFPETTHFFHGKLIMLRDAVVSFVDEHSGLSAES
jgi:alpha/beta superfamily hydrolase